MKKFNLVFVIIFLFSGSILFGQTPNWVGGTGDWDNPANWTGGVPTTTTNVIINNTGSNVTIPNGVDAVARSIKIYNGSLMVNETASLSIDGASNTSGLLIQGNTEDANFTNHGTTSITNIAGGAINLTLNCNFHNSATGTLTIDGTSGNQGHAFTSFATVGTMLNEGTMNMTNINKFGLYIFSGANPATIIFVNAATGTININNITSIGLSLGNNNSIENAGSINLGPGLQSRATSINGGSGFSNFHNLSGGQVNILDAGTAAANLSDGLFGSNAAFLNDGNLCIDENNVTNTLISSNLTFTNNGSYNQLGCAATVASAFLAIPTMGEWALIILALIILSVGVIYVMRWKREELVELAK